MKRNKKLQKCVDESLEHFHNDKLWKQFKTVISEQKAERKAASKNKKVRYAIFTSAGTAIVIVILTCILLLVPRGGDKGGSNNVPLNKTYFGEHQEIEESSIGEVNSAMSQIKFSSENIININKAIDNYYNEILYFLLQYSLTDDLDAIKFIVDTNEDYEYSFKNNFYNMQTTVKGYEVEYLETITEEDGVYQFIAYGQIIDGNEKVYIDYYGYSLDAQSNFLTILEAVIE